MPSFFFRNLQPCFILIYYSYTSWSTRFITVKVCEWFSIFNSVLFLLNFIFLFNKSHELCDFNVIFFFQVKIRKATYSFGPRLLIFKLQEAVGKFNDICMTRSSSKTDLETNFLNLQNLSFEYVTFFLYSLLSKYLMVNIH